MNTNAPPIIYECLTSDQLRDDLAWWEIYEQQFPLEEREPAQAAFDMLQAELGIAIRARRGGVTIGLATAHLLRRPPVVFLLYLASAANVRALGIGSQLIEYAWQKGAALLAEKGFPALGLLWEVENPALAANDVERERREQRLAFYRRRGAHLLACPYAQPPLHGTQAVPLALMFRPAPGGQLPDRETMAGLVQAVYFEKYAVVNRIPASLLDDLLAKLIPL